MKKSTVATVKTATLTAEEKKARRNEQQKARRAAKKFEAEQTAKHAATVVDLGSVVIPETSFEEANSIENIEVEEALGFESNVLNVAAETLGCHREELVAALPETATVAEIAQTITRLSEEAAPARKAGMDEAAAVAAASEFISGEVVAWSVTHDAKGKGFVAPRFRVGFKVEGKAGRLVEDGKQIVGAGNSFAEAVSDGRKRVAAKAAPAA